MPAWSRRYRRFSTPTAALGSRPPPARLGDPEAPGQSFVRSGAKNTERGAPHAVAAARPADRDGGRGLALAEYPGASAPGAGDEVRRRSRQRAARGLALSHGLGRGAARVRTAVRPLRPTAGRAGGPDAREP